VNVVQQQDAFAAASIRLMARRATSLLLMRGPVVRQEIRDPTYRKCGLSQQSNYLLRSITLLEWPSTNCTIGFMICGAR
jgi:hypothetical protein